MKRCLRCRTPFAGDDWRCPQCGFTAARLKGFPAFAPELSGVTEGFDPALHAELARLEAGNFWFRARNRLIAWAIRRYFPEAKAFLEIGCGTGYVLSGVAAAFPHAQLSASEVHADALPYAADRVPAAAFFQMDARAIPFESEFDLIGAFDVIEHIEADEEVLSEMHRAAVPGGGALITVPQHPFLWSAFDVHSHHVRRYTAAELRRKVIAAGFEIVRMTSFVSLLLPLMLASRLARRDAGEGYDPLRELRVKSWVNGALEKMLDIERMAIRAGVSWPAGGSLLVVARRRK